MTDSLPHGVILVCGHAAPYRVRHSARARYTSLQIHPRRGIEVVLPASASRADALSILQEKRSWLERNTDMIWLATRNRAVVRDGVRLALRGEWLTVSIAAGAPPRVTPLDGRLRVVTRTPHDLAAVRTQIERWYRREARRVIEARVTAQHSPADGPVLAVAIRDQDTRWGSCSSDGRLSFNWRLILAPPPVLDAVVAHELVHLRIPNHSPPFWEALDQRAPRHRACRRWLDANAFRLGL